MNTSKINYSSLIAISLLTGCASGPTALEQALSIPADKHSSISVDELLDRAIVQSSKNTLSAKPIEYSSEQRVPLATIANTPHHSLLSKADLSLLLTFISDRSELTSRHLKQLQKFTQRNNTTNYLTGQKALVSVKISCAPSGQTNPYAAASTAMSRCLNVSRYLERTTPNPEISLAPNLPANQIKISQ